VLDRFRHWHRLGSRYWRWPAAEPGPLLLVFYAGVALASMGGMDTPAGWSATVNGFLAALGGTLLVISSLWLESLCIARDQGTTSQR